MEGFRGLADGVKGSHTCVRWALINGDIHDSPGAGPAHARQYALGQAEQPEDIGFELAADIIDRKRLERAGLAVAGIVDQRADRAFGLLDCCNRFQH